MTIAIFIKLFATKIVANSFFGNFKRVVIITVDLELSSPRDLISDLVSENNATSAPEIKAELINNNKSKINAKTNVVISVSNF